MKIKKSRKKPLKFITLIIAVLIVIVGAYAAYAASNNIWPFPGSYNSHDEQSSEKNDDAKQTDSSKQKNSNENKATSPPSKTPPQYDTDPGKSTPKDTLTGVINYKAVNDDSLVLRTTINQDVSSGICVLTLSSTSTSKTYKESVDIIQRPSASNCNGFTIPLSKLGNGTWNISIGLTSGSKSGTLTGNVVINE